MTEHYHAKEITAAHTGGTNIGMQRSDKGYIPVSGHRRQLALMPEFHRPGDAGFASMNMPR